MMLSNLFRLSQATKAPRTTATAPAAVVVDATAHTCAVEHLEPRQFMSATLKVDNLDIIPGYERMIFNRIGVPNTTYPNYVKDKGSLKLTNTGNQTLTLSGATISGPFKLLNSLPSSLPVGKSVTIGVQFTATKPPPYTYNQTNYTNKASSAGTYVGSLTFKTNDPKNPTFKEGLAGWYQGKSEDNQEPGLQTIINLMGDYKTNIAPARTVTLSQGTTPKYYGEETVSAYWKAADPNKGVFVRQIAAFHTQGSVTKMGWYKKSDKVYRQALLTSGLAGQAFLPYKDGQKGVPATVSIATGSNVFGFKIAAEWSDDKLNAKKSGGGHHVRFYPVRDHFGTKLANTYFMTMDYSDVSASQNWDFQDNVYVVSNIVPAGN